MKRPLVSVVLATYQRAHLLRRAVHGYNRSDFDLSALEVVVVDDGSTDGTDRECERFDHRIDVKYVRLRKPAGLWRDCAAVINHGIRIATGGYVVITHPEIVPGRRSLAAVVESHRQAVGAGHPAVWVSCKGYYLKPADMEHLDAVDLDGRGPLAARDIPGFRDPVAGGNPDFRPDAVDRATVWHSWIFGGTDRATWKSWGGVIPTERWGSVDIALMARRQALKVATATPQADDALVLHLNHDDPRVNVVTPRVEFGPGGWREEMDALGLTAETCKYPHVDEIGW